MNKVDIDLGDRSYPIFIQNDYSLFSTAVEEAKLKGKFVIVTDSNVEKHQLMEFMDAFHVKDATISHFVIEAGEKSKNLNTIGDLYHFMNERKLERNDTLIALGGGVVGDITGFAAATYLRGINFIQVPTTLLAQADSSVGGKVGVDFQGGKNIVGAFYQPKLVYINVNTLRTLPKREVTSGLAEVIKHGLIWDASYYKYLRENLHRIFSFDEEVLAYMTKMNCTIKGSVVEKDEKENGLRAILNFGHTYGHAIESVSEFKLLHGECVAIGMVAAYLLAEQLGMISLEEVENVKETLKNAGLPIDVKGLDCESIYAQMFFDKKVKNKELVFVLPEAIGKVIQKTIVDEKMIKEVIKKLV